MAFSNFSIVATIFGFILLGFTIWAIVPRFGDEPPNAVVADPKEFPELNHIVKLIANSLEVDVPKVLLTEQFDATFGRIGFRRTPLLILGHPFLALLEPQEIVSLIAHELAHDRDGTITRSMPVQIAYSAVNRWKLILNPRNFVWRHIPILPLLIPAAILWMPVQIFSNIFAFIKQREGHHAEYEADRLSVAISGNGSAESLMRKSLYGHIVPLQRAYMEAPPASKFEIVSQVIKMVPEKEIERLWRIAHIVAEREVAQTHPPLKSRLKFVNSFDNISPFVRLTAKQFATLQVELMKWPMVLNERKVNARNESSTSAQEHALAVAAGD